MTDQPIVQTAVDVHRPESIQAHYMVRSDGARFTDLVIGNLRLTIHGAHAETARMLMAAAGGCPEALPGVWESYEDLRERTLREDAVRGVGA